MATDQQKQFGADGEDAVRETLRKLSGHKIAGFFRTENLVCVGRQVQLDFLVLVPHVGLVILEVKTWKGRIHLSLEEKWQRELSNFTNYFGNGALQAVRASGLVLQMLEQERCNYWPIRSLVVFPNEKSELIYPSSVDKLQADVIYLHQLETWISQNHQIGYVKNFSAQDFAQIKKILAKYHAPFNPALNGHQSASP